VKLMHTNVDTMLDRRDTRVDTDTRNEIQEGRWDDVVELMNWNWDSPQAVRDPLPSQFTYQRSPYECRNSCARCCSCKADVLIEERLVRLQFTTGWTYFLSDGLEVPVCRSGVVWKLPPL
jgi:hypothetical protein